MKSIQSTSYTTVLLLILTYSAFSKLSLGISAVGPLTQTALKCLARYQLSDSPSLFAIVRVYELSPTPGIDPNSYKTLVNLKTVTVDGGYNIHVYMQICRGKDPAQQVTALVDSLSIDLYQTIFIKVDFNNIEGCSWEGYNIVDNCNFITQAINTINELNRQRSGIFSRAHVWQQFFGNNCQEVSQITKHLWYVRYNRDGKVSSEPSFDDFVPFGGWRSPNFKQVGGNITVNLCGHSDWHAYFDYVISSDY